MYASSFAATDVYGNDDNEGNEAACPRPGSALRWCCSWRVGVCPGAASADMLLLEACVAVFVAVCGAAARSRSAASLATKSCRYVCVRECACVCVREREFVLVCVCVGGVWWFCTLPIGCLARTTESYKCGCMCVCVSV